MAAGWFISVLPGWGCSLAKQTGSSGTFGMMKCLEAMELSAGSALATAFPRYDNASQCRHAALGLSYGLLGIWLCFE